MASCVGAPWPGNALQLLAWRYSPRCVAARTPWPLGSPLGCRRDKLNQAKLPSKLSFSPIGVHPFSPCQTEGPLLSQLCHLSILLFPARRSTGQVYKDRVSASFPQGESADTPFSFGGSPPHGADLSRLWCISLTLYQPFAYIHWKGLVILNKHWMSS